MMISATKEYEKPDHKNSNSNNIVIFIGFSLYSVVLPIVVLIALANILIDAFSVRTQLLGTEKRTINRSQLLLTRK